MFTQTVEKIVKKQGVVGGFPYQELTRKQFVSES